MALDIWPNAHPTGEIEGSDYTDPGFNYIVTRTEKGEDLLRAVLKAKALTLTEREVGYELIREAQPQHLRKRTQALAKATAATLLVSSQAVCLCL